MGKRDSQYELCGTIELDEGLLSTEIPEEEKNKPLKRGRGSQKKRLLCWLWLKLLPERMMIPRAERSLQLSSI